MVILKEQVIPCTTEHFSIRIWRQLPESGEAHNCDVEAMLKVDLYHEKSISNVLQRLCELPRVNAVEAKDLEIGATQCWYVNWP